MTNTARRKGTAWEVSVRDLAIAHGFADAHRLSQAGSKDIGDLWLHPNLVVEAKALKAFDLAEAVTEAKHEADNADADWWFAALKRRQHPAASGYAITELDVMLRLCAAVLLRPNIELVQSVSRHPSLNGSFGLREPQEPCAEAAACLSQKDGRGNVTHLHRPRSEDAS